uniref:Uncharacterized protein n=1 Tax=Odontella aurita TaxID=265563 RepID=A0A7S4K6B9_9STRA
MAPREHASDGFKDLMKLSGAGESGRPPMSPPAQRKEVSHEHSDTASPQVGEPSAADEREKARRILALCDLAERGGSSSLSSVGCGGAGDSLSSPATARRPSRGPDMIRHFSSDLLGSVLGASDLADDLDSDSHSPTFGHCSRCQDSDAELASLRATVEGLRTDLRRTAQKREEDLAKIELLQLDNLELSTQHRAAEDECQKLRDEVREMQSREDWLEGENERLRVRMEAGSSNLSDPVVELANMSSLEESEEEGEYNNEQGSGDKMAVPESYFDHTQRC